MSKFYLVFKDYSPNTAATNRLLGMLKQFSEREIDTDVVFFIPDAKKSKAPTLSHVKYHYYWKWFPIRNSRINLFLYQFVYTCLFFLTVKKGDVISIFGCDRMVELLAGKRGVKVYLERTEHPEVSHLRFFNIKKYLQKCTLLDGLFVISEALKDYFVSKGIDCKKIHIVNMMVDPSRFYNLEKKTKERYIAYCGKATNNKDGVDSLIKAFALTSKKHPDVKLIIIGTPPQKADESGNLELVESLGLNSKVVFAGLVPSDKIPQILKNAEALALNRPDNKQAKYGFPTKLGEYLLTGNPVIVTKVGDIPLFLKDKESALLAEPDNLEDFASKMNWVLDNKTTAKKIGEAGYAIALKEFDSQTETNKIIKVIFDQ